MALRIRHLAREIEDDIASGDAARVVERVQAYGLTNAERSAVCRELDARAKQAALEAQDEFRRLVFGPFDQAKVEVRR